MFKQQEIPIFLKFKKVFPNKRGYRCRLVKGFQPWLANFLMSSRTKECLQALGLPHSLGHLLLYPLKQNKTKKIIEVTIPFSRE